jgi:hypothetical protein
VKRDLDLIRELMLELEANEKLNGRYRLNCFASELFNRPPEEDDRIAYHLMQILDEGWLVGQYVPTAGSFDLSRLTADGHDFIDATRSPDIWKRARSAIEGGGAETLRFAWDVAKTLAKREIEKRIQFD